jgi:hypothetical protein
VPLPPIETLSPSAITNQRWRAAGAVDDVAPVKTMVLLGETMASERKTEQNKGELIGSLRIISGLVRWLK